MSREDTDLGALAELLKDNDVRLNALEQKHALGNNAGVASGGGVSGNAATFGGRVRAGLANAKEERGKTVVIVTGGIDNLLTKNTIINSPNRLTAVDNIGIAPVANAPLNLIDNITIGQTGGTGVEYAQQTSYTNNAAETSEGESKPESAIGFTLVDAPVRTIAHFLRASKQILADSAQLQSFIDSQMTYGVRARLEHQVLVGNAASPNLSGMLHAGNFTNFTPDSGASLVHSVIAAIGQAVAAGGDVGSLRLVLNPTDWVTEQQRIVDADDTGAASAAFFSAGFGSQIVRVPVVLSNSMTSGDFALYDKRVVQLLIRDDVRVELFEQDADNVTKNLITVRAEARGVLCVYQPALVISGPITQ